ncbi:hypothetical protein [Microbacterium paludicola]|uniref:hypothetical protein n=1 Tax=Microbacterium paludicola TaxID=300019 RepID=UPI0011AB247C|nr:hypothetical protein [Microbacterium paludicola]
MRISLAPSHPLAALRNHDPYALGPLQVPVQNESLLAGISQNRPDLAGIREISGRSVLFCEFRAHHPSRW